MTAAGFALPFGLWFFAWLALGRFPVPDWPARRWPFFVAMEAPLAAGFAIFLWTNEAITGSPWKSPYEVYNEVYTPRHIYGFDNRARGEARLGPRVMASYDEWAVNLTPRLAIENVARRFVATWNWTLGIAPLAMGAAVFLFGVPTTDRRWWLIPTAIVSLHAVHVPYWFVGIMEWHYVFESGPLWLLMLAGATGALVAFCRDTARRWLPACWLLLVALTILPTFVSFDPVWPRSRLETAVEEVGFARARYAAFQKLVAEVVQRRPALVLVVPDSADVSMDFVNNDPPLDTEVLYGRLRPSTSVDDVMRNFPDRALYVFEPHFNVDDWRLVPLHKIAE
jgi:hypothetical protein